MSDEEVTDGGDAPALVCISPQNWAVLREVDRCQGVVVDGALDVCREVVEVGHLREKSVC